MKINKDLKKCLDIQARAKKRIPGMTQLLSKRPDMFSQGTWPGYYKKAKGAKVWDMDGNEYLDMSLSGIGANILGYADPDVDKAVVNAIKNGNNCTLNCPEELELADLLCELHPWADMVRFARAGGEAMAVAVRIARAHTGKDKIAFCGYHGWHDWYLAANLKSEDALDDHLIPGLEPSGVPKGLIGTSFPFRYNEIEGLNKIVNDHSDEIAAIVMEPIRNHEPAPGFISQIRKIADNIGAVFIVDEISSGFRFTPGGAHLVYFDENPDIAVFSKALGNGYPIAAIIGKEKIMQSAQKTFISSTYWTERIGPVAAIATIKKCRELNVSSHLIEFGGLIMKGWATLADKNNLSIEVGGIKPMCHFDFKYKNPQAINALFIQLMLEQGFLATNSYYAMFAHTINHIKNYLKAVDYAFKTIREHIEKGSVDENLIGRPSSSGFERLN